MDKNNLDGIEKPWEIIEKRRKQIGMSVNKLKIISGIKSGDHLTKILKNKTKNPGRRHLIQICFALRWNSDDIDKILKGYNQNKLSADDTERIWNVYETRGFPKNYHYPIYFHTPDFSITQLAIKLKPGNVKTVATSILDFAKYESKDVFESSDDFLKVRMKPSVYMRDISYQMKEVLEILPENDQKDILKDLKKELNIDLNWKDFIQDATNFSKTVDEKFKNATELIVSKEKERFHENIKKYKLTQLICIQCLEDSIISYANKGEIDLITKSFNELFKKMLAYDNYHFKLIAACCSTNFLIKEIDSSPIVLFYNIPTHLSPTTYANKPLSGFISTSKELYQNYNNEFNNLERSALEECSDKERLIKFIIEDLLENNGIKGKGIEWVTS